MQYFSIQHWTLLPSLLTSTNGCCFCFGSISSWLLELVLHWSPVAYWAPTDLGSSSFTLLSFCLFVLFMGFSRQEYWSGLPFLSPVDHIFSKLSTMTRLSWVAPWAWLSFIELDKAVVLVWLDWLVFYDYGFSVSALWCPPATPTVCLGFLTNISRTKKTGLLTSLKLNTQIMWASISHLKVSWKSPTLTFRDEKVPVLREKRDLLMITHLHGLPSWLRW